MSVPSQDFPVTRWTLVNCLRQDSAKSEEALNELCQIYWFPVYSFLRKQGFSVVDSEDTTQSFFAKLLKTNGLNGAEEVSGKLRSYLLAALKNHCIDQWRRDHAARRLHATQLVPFDPDPAESRFSELSGREVSPEEAFDQGWFATVMEETRAQLRESLQKRGRAGVFEILEPFLDDFDQESEAFGEAAQKLEISRGSMRVTVFRFREKFRWLVRQRIQETVSDEAEFAEEFEYFLRIGLPNSHRMDEPRKSESS